MSGPRQTGLFLLVIVAAILAWEIRALFWMDEGSTVSEVVGPLFTDWPWCGPVWLITVAVFWHFIQVGTKLSSLEK